MPRTRSLAWSELKIGVLTILAIVIAAVTIFMLTGGRGFFWQRYKLKTRFDNVAGLKSGSPVRVAGVEVGIVTSVDDFVGEQVDVTFEVNKSMRARITTVRSPTSARCRCWARAPWTLRRPRRARRFPTGDTFRRAARKGQIADVAEQAQQSVAEITGLVTDIRTGKGTVGKLMTDERLYQRPAAVRRLGGGVDAWGSRRPWHVGQTGERPQDGECARRRPDNIQSLTEQINAGQGSLGKLLKDDAFVRSLNGATTNIQDLTAKLNRGEGTAGKLMTDQALYNKLDAVTGRFDELLTRLNDGEGHGGTVAER